ncbi:MAG: hypothetical protein EYC62_00030 [Alphaproteobacteria bacterium]|nr:MAG: hypothetical protein EYC62_00030 [Alphaproteobacteria bacterium]
MSVVTAKPADATTLFEIKPRREPGPAKTPAQIPEIFRDSVKRSEILGKCKQVMRSLLRPAEEAGLVALRAPNRDLLISFYDALTGWTRHPSVYTANDIFSKLDGLANLTSGATTLGPGELAVRAFQSTPGSRVEITPSQGNTYSVSRERILFFAIRMSLRILQHEFFEHGHIEQASGVEKLIKIMQDHEKEHMDSRADRDGNKGRARSPSTIRSNELYCINAYLGLNNPVIEQGSVSLSAIDLHVLQRLGGHSRPMA